MNTLNLFIVCVIYTSNICGIRAQVSDVSKTGLICVPIKNCSYITDLLTIKPKNIDVNKLILSLKCNNNNQPHVWCTDPESIIVKKENEIVERGQNISKTGLSCVPIKNCTYAIELIKFKPLKKNVIELILSLKCGTTEESRDIWCPNVETVRQEELDSIFNPNLCGYGMVPNRKKRTVGGGENAFMGEFPWMVILEYRNKNNELKHQCGGTLINEKYVLTAAHCLLIGGSTAKLESVVLGAHDTSEPSEDEQRYAVEKYIIHPLYEATAMKGLHHHDIGLVKLAETVEFTESVLPVCMPNLRIENDISDRTEYIVAGWGLTATGNASTILQKLKVPQYDSANCTRILEYNIMSTQICAGGESGKDSCRGDSGGPLMVMDKTNRVSQVGIISLSVGRGCGVGRPNIYTDLRKYIGWIYENIKINE